MDRAFSPSQCKGVTFVCAFRSFANGTFSLFNMPLSDIADDDKEKYKRKYENILVHRSQYTNMSVSDVCVCVCCGVCVCVYVCVSVCVCVNVCI